MAQITPASHLWYGFPGNPQWFETPLEDWSNEYDAITAGQSPWVGTALAGGTLIQTVDLTGGIARFGNAANTDNSGYQIQRDMETVALVQGKKTEFTIRLRASDITNVNFFAGLAITDTTVLHATTGTLAGSVTASDAVGFISPEGEDGVYGVVIRDSSQVIVTGSLATLADGTWATLAFRVTMDSATAGKGSVQFAVNGTWIGDNNATSTTMPYDAEEYLTDTFAMAARAASTMTVDLDWGPNSRVER